METSKVSTSAAIPVPINKLYPLTTAPTSEESHPVISIGIAVASEAAAMAALGAKSFAETFGHSVPEEDLADFLATTYSTEAIATDILDPAKTTFVARGPAEGIIGIIQLLRGKSDPSVEGTMEELAVLQKLYVDTSFHGQGIGSKLIAAVEDMAREEQFKQIWLTVWEGNIGAQKLYEKLGYIKTGETDFATGACIQTDWVLAKHL